MKRNTWLVPAIVTTALLTACGGDDNNNTDRTEPNARYEFDSQFVDGESAVSYTGQTVRQLLIADLTSTIENLESGESKLEKLKYYVDGAVDTGVVDKEEYLFRIQDKTLYQVDNDDLTFGSISKGKNLSDKVAGKDENTHLVGGQFEGWDDIDEDDNTRNTPIALVHYFLKQIDDLVTNSERVQVITESGDVNIEKAYIDAQGRDYKQLTQKFLLGAVTFSQGTADYLKTDFSSNNEQDGDKPYTKAEHRWDEAFGYFGAARDYSDYTDDEIAGKGGRDDYKNGYHDTDDDGLIDLRSEINLANSTNCAKRDRGTDGATNFTKQAFDAFMAGRKILNNAAKETHRNLTKEENDALKEQSNIAASVWEKCIAATVVHYINEVRADLADAGKPITGFSDKKAYTNLAKHWSEMKGFALGLQFNPESPFHKNNNISKFVKLHELMRTKPVLPNGQGGSDSPLNAYLENLDKANAIMKEVYAFDQKHVENW